MIRVSALLLGVLLAGLHTFAEATPSGDPTKGEGPALAVQRGGGFVDPAKSPWAHYEFTLANDGSWELKPLKGAPKKGKLPGGDVGKWVKEIEAAGFDQLKSNPALGAADEPYMDITLRADGKQRQKRIPLEAKLSQALEKKILELGKIAK